MSEIRKWLEAIGLAQYADAFEANDIDMDLLRQIDDPVTCRLSSSHLSCHHKRTHASSRSEVFITPSSA